MYFKLEQKPLQNKSKFPIYKSEISDLFCRRFLFQLRMYFALHNKSKFPLYKSEVSDLFCQRVLLQVRVHFVVYNKSEISETQKRSVTKYLIFLQTAFHIYDIT